jgi:two-component system, OmpR family, phosphate regulon sensor histidine kinase PhoR
MNTSKRRLRWTLGAFLFALVVPTAVLIYQAYGQLRAETFYQHRVLAEELANRIDLRMRAVIDTEEARALADYGFLVVQGGADANFVQRSPLSGFPVEAAVPGLLAYFQIDSHGAFSTPLVPVGVDAAAYGVSAADLAQREALQQRVRELLNGADVGAARGTTVPAGVAGGLGAVLSKSEAKSDSSQALFDRLAAPSTGKSIDESAPGDAGYGRIADLELDSGYAARRENGQFAPREAEPVERQRISRKERALLAPTPAAATVPANAAANAPTNAPASRSDVRVGIFETELDPFAFRRLDADRFVLFRKVALNGERLIQGAVIDQAKFIEGIVAAPFRETLLSQMSNLIVGYQGEVVDSIDGRRADNYALGGKMRGALLYRSALSAPLHDFELVFTITQLPVGPGGRVIGWTTLVLVLVLCGGFWGVYRLGVRQIDLNAQQQDFVSAVSHELKTPLTSIRMYGEILRAGWADEEKKKSYYDFIYHESERLSRLINNVLRLARLTHNGDDLDRKPVKAAELLRLVESKVAAQVEQAGFTLQVDRTPIAGDPSILVDADSVVQILINLVDNALKFSARAAVKVVEFGCRAQSGGAVLFWVRDHGPGVPKAQMRKIFELFYRPEGELTRETVGTGIGLALVHQLTIAMGGSVHVRNCEPGAEFSVIFPSGPSAAD